MKHRIILALIVASLGGCSRSALVAPVVAKVAASPIAVGDRYSPIQPADPFKFRDWYVQVNGVQRGFVQYEILDHEFRPLDHEQHSCTEAEFRESFPAIVQK